MVLKFAGENTCSDSENVNKKVVARSYDQIRLKKEAVILDSLFQFKKLSTQVHLSLIRSHLFYDTFYPGSFRHRKHNALVVDLTIVLKNY